MGSYYGEGAIFSITMCLLSLPSHPTSAIYSSIGISWHNPIKDQRPVDVTNLSFSLMKL